MYVVEVDCTRSLWVLWKSYLLYIFARCYIFSLLQLPWPSLPIELSQFNKSYIYTASVPLPNGCPLIYRLRLGHLLPHRYSCETDSINIPLLGNVEGSSIVCMTRKLEELMLTVMTLNVYLLFWEASKIYCYYFWKTLRNIWSIYHVELNSNHPTNTDIKINSMCAAP